METLGPSGDGCPPTLCMSSDPSMLTWSWADPGGSR